MRRVCCLSIAPEVLMARFTVRGAYSTQGRPTVASRATVRACPSAKAERGLLPKKTASNATSSGEHKETIPDRHSKRRARRCERGSVCGTHTVPQSRKRKLFPSRSIKPHPVAVRPGSMPRMRTTARTHPSPSEDRRAKVSSVMSKFAQTCCTSSHSSKASSIFVRESACLSST